MTREEIRREWRTTKQFNFIHCDFIYEAVDFCGGYGKMYQYIENSGLYKDLDLQRFLRWYARLTPENRYEMRYYW